MRSAAVAARSLGAATVALGALARGRTRTRRSNLSLRLRTVQVHGRERARRGARVPTDGTHPGGEPVRRAGSGRDRRGVDPSATCRRSRRCWSSSTRRSSPSPGTGQRRPGWPTGVQVQRGRRLAVPLVRGRTSPQISSSCAASSGTSAAPDITPTIQALRGILPPGWPRRSGPGTGARRMRRRPSGPTSQPPGSPRSAFVAPEATVMTVGHHRLDGPTDTFDPGRRLFDFVGDGFTPA